MKQEHAMTPGVLVSGSDMSAGDYKARCAVLEAELAELRKRVCVPEGWRVVPVEPTIDMSAAARREVHGFITFGKAEQVYRSMIAAAPACSGQTEPLYITHRPLIHNAINLLGMRRPVAPDVELVINGLRSMLDGMPTPAEPAAEHWIAVAQSAAPAPVERAKQAACTGKNCGSTDPKLHSAECFAEHEQAITPTAAQDVAGLVEALRTVVGMLHHKATTPLERESIRIAEAAIYAHQSGGAK